MVLLGVREKHGRFEVAGIENPEKLRTELFNHLSNRQKVSVNLLTDANVRELQIEGKTVLAVEIPRAGRKQRPVHLTLNPFNGNTSPPHSPESSGESSGQGSGETGARILSLLAQSPTLTAPELAHRLGLSTQAVEKQLAKLKTQSRLRRVGPRKGGHWEVLLDPSEADR